MTKKSRASAAAGAVRLAVVIVSTLAAGAASAAALSFVSMKGVNTGDCSNPATPCRTFAYALGQTTAGGEIRALDAGNYNSVLITKSITISGPPGAGVLRTTAGGAISIAVGATGIVTLDGLTLNGFNKVASDGVRVTSAGRLIIRNCVIKNFSSAGVFMTATAANNYQIENTLFANNGTGVFASTGNNAGSTAGTLNRVTVHGSSVDGMEINARARARVSDSLFANNAINGIEARAVSTAALFLTRSVVTLNGTGVLVDNSSPPQVPLAETGGDNFIFGNTTNIVGPLTSVGTN